MSFPTQDSLVKTTDVYSSSLFAGKVAFITGGGSGICYALAKSYLIHGGSVAIFSRSKERIDKAVEALKLIRANANVLGYSGDVRNPDDLISAMKQTFDHFGKINVVVAGAAGNFVSSIENLSPKGFKTVIDIDLLGTFNTFHAALPYLKESKGVALAISATFHRTAAESQVHCAAAKAGIDAIIRTAALEWGPLGIRTVGIAPGPIANTVGMQKLGGGKAFDKIAKGVPLRSMGYTTDIEHSFIYLVSDAARFVTGEVIIVDGGLWMTGQSVGSKL